MHEQLIIDLRARSKFHSGVDWRLLRNAADALDTQSLTPESVMAYFNEHGIKLLHWQQKKLLGDVVELGVEKETEELTV
jgi:hypothetical protein